MYPQLFEIFGIKIRSFGVMAAVGLLLAFWLMNHRAKKANEDGQALSDILFFAMIGALIGARSLYVIRNWEAEFSHDFLKVFRINEGGIVFQGGFIGGMLVAWFLCKRKNIDFFRAIDIVAPCLALGHAMGRIGCYLNGCCFGGICKSGWAVHFPPKSLPFQHQVQHNGLSPLAPYSLPVHPTQLYSFAANVIICLILVFMTAKLKVKGHVFSLYLMLYGVWRLSIEFLRDDQSRHLGLSVAQYIAIGQFILGLVLWNYFSRKFGKTEIELEDGTVAN